MKLNEPEQAHELDLVYYAGQITMLIPSDKNMGGRNCGECERA